MKCKINEIVIKNIETTWAKNHVVPTTADQKNEVPNPKKIERIIAFFLLVKFKSNKYINKMSKLPINIDTCCCVILSLSKINGIKTKDAPGGKGI